MSNSVSWDDVDLAEFEKESTAFSCPNCKAPLVLPSGDPESSYAIVGEFPGDEELKAGRVMVGAMAGVFRTELSFVDLSLNSFRLLNLWFHKPNDDVKCFDESLKACLKELQGKQVVLLVGGETVSYFCNEKVSDVNGLVVTSKYIDAPLVMAMVNPAIVFHGPVGELRFSVKRFADELKKYQTVHVEKRSKEILSELGWD